MKLLALLLTYLLFIQTALAGLPPTTLSGQNSASKTTTFNYIVPNNQATTVAGGRLLETGNNNLLINPSFEHSTATTGWDTVNGGAGGDTVRLHGFQSLVTSPSAQTFSVSQSSSTNAPQLDGVQMLAMVRVRTSVSGVKVCAVNDGTVSTTLCVDVVSNSKWGLYKVPFVGTTTSNGISIAATASVTGNVYIDDAFVGAVDLKQDVEGARPDYVTKAAGNAGQAITGGSTNIPFILVSDNASAWNGTQYTVPEDGIYTIDMSVHFTTSMGNALEIYIGGVQDNRIGENITDSVHHATVVRDFTKGQVLSFRTYAGGTLTNLPKLHYLTITKQARIVPLSTYSSTNADTDWGSCGHTTADFTGFGATPTSIETQCKRDGSDLLMRGKFISATSTAVEARINLKLNGVALISANSSKIPSIQIAGRFATNANLTNSVNGSGNTLIEPSVAYFTFSGENTAGLGLTKQNGSQISGSHLVSFNTRIPINGWEQSNIIIGQFNGLESCTDSYECTDTFSATTSKSGVTITVSKENIDWIDSCSNVSTGIFTCTFRAGTFSVAPNCFATGADTVTAQNIHTFQTVSSTGFTLHTLQRTDAATYSDTTSTVFCQKQGADYIGKTAKAVASDQNVRSIGSTNVDIQSVYFGSGANCASNCTTGTCTICRQIGSKITSVTYASLGNYWVNGIDGLGKYACSVSGGSAGVGASSGRHEQQYSTTSAAFLQFGVGGTSYNASVATATCIAKDQ